MISKRTAITALLAGIIGKMAHADDKDQTVGTSGTTMTTFSLVQQPSHWTINLDQTTGITLSLHGEKLTVSTEEIMEALRR